jgi:hypothetical protein
MEFIQNSINHRISTHVTDKQENNTNVPKNTQSETQIKTETHKTNINVTSTNTNNTNSQSPKGENSNLHSAQSPKTNENVPVGVSVSSETSTNTNTDTNTNTTLNNTNNINNPNNINESKVTIVKTVSTSPIKGLPTGSPQIIRHTSNIASRDRRAATVVVPGPSDAALVSLQSNTNVLLSELRYFA